MIRAIRARGGVEPIFVQSVDEVPNALAQIVKDHDVILTMGAGDVGGLPQRLVDLGSDEN